MAARTVYERVQETLFERRLQGGEIPEPQDPDRDALRAFEPVPEYPWRRIAASPSNLPLVSLAVRNDCDVRELLAYDGAGFVTNGFRAVLARDPDPEGLQRMLDRLAAGWPKVVLLAALRYDREGRRCGVRVRGLLPRLAWACLWEAVGPSAWRQGRIGWFARKAVKLVRGGGAG